MRAFQTASRVGKELEKNRINPGEAAAPVEAPSPAEAIPAGADRATVAETAPEIPPVSPPDPQSEPQPARGKKGRRGRKAQAQVVVRPVAQPAKMRRRHWGVIWSFVILVLLPLGGVIGYMSLVAQDQYASTTGFTVRQEESKSATELMGGLAQLTGAAASPDGDVLYEFIRSQGIVRRIDEQLDLRGYYASRWSSDPAFALWPDAAIEDLHWFWDRAVRVSYDQGSGLTQLEVLAFDPEMAQRIAQAVVQESQEMVNALNAAARQDAIRYSKADLDDALDRLLLARQALTQFRTRTQIVDLNADLQGRMGVMSTLQQTLAQELIAFDELRQSTRATDPRLTQVQRRIEVIRERIAEERAGIAAAEVRGTGEDYPTLMAEFEGLMVQREFAESAYRAALTAYDAAQANAVRQSRYLATYIPPTLAETARYPKRPLIIGLAALFLMLSWGIIVLIYYSIRDRG